MTQELDYRDGHEQADVSPVLIPSARPRACSTNSSHAT
jgi:hypothetical protein